VITIFNQSKGQLLQLASFSFLLAAAPFMVMAVTPENELRAYITTEAALEAVYGQSATYWSSDTRAEALAERGASRHALVLYKTPRAMSGLGQKLCHAALGRKERNAWLDQLADVADGDHKVAQRLAGAATPTIRLKGTEYSSLRDWNGWKVGACVVPESNISTLYPPLPDVSTIRTATYEVGKQLYAAGEEDQALIKFKTLKIDPEIYPSALLYIVAILHESHPEIAKALNEEYVELEKVNDLDALEVYVRYSSRKK
jgi:hypothetical protein